MKLLLFSGSHPRHLFVHKSIIDLGFDYHAIVMEREELLPTPPRDIHESDIKIFNKHFEDRYKVEKDAYQEIEITDVFQSDKLTVVSPEDLNSKAVLNLIMADKFDMSFIFGPDMIKEPILSNLPQVKMNLHLTYKMEYLKPYYLISELRKNLKIHHSKRN